MDQVEAQRAIATFNSFRFFGLVFLLPGFVGPNLPQGFATPVAYGDLATALLAILALLTVRVRFLFWPLVWGFNLVGLADLVINTARAVSVNLPSVAGNSGPVMRLGRLCDPTLYVPALFSTHLLAFWCCCDLDAHPLAWRMRQGRSPRLNNPERDACEEIQWTRVARPSRCVRMRSKSPLLTVQL